MTTSSPNKIISTEIPKGLSNRQVVDLFEQMLLLRHCELQTQKLYRVGRLHTEPVVHPFAAELESMVVVSVEKISAAAKAVLNGQPIVPRRIRAFAESIGMSQKATNVDSAPKIVSESAKARVQEVSVSKEEGVPLTMPNQDLTITEAKVVNWLKKVGESVTSGEGVVEVETDKAVFEIESPVKGILVEVLAPENTIVLLGQQMGTIKPENGK